MMSSDDLLSMCQEMGELTMEVVLLDKRKGKMAMWYADSTRFMVDDTTTTTSSSSSGGWEEEDGVRIWS